MNINNQLTEATIETSDAEVLKYIHVEGRVTVECGIDSKGEKALILKFVDGHFNPIPGMIPIFIYDAPVKFKYVHLIAEFNEEGFRAHEAMLRAIDPLLEEWDHLEPSDGGDDMNPSGEPKPKH